MKLIERTEYLNTLVSLAGTPEIKVITGIRRCGKSKLMEAFIEKLCGLYPGSNIIHINFSEVKNEYLREYHSLLYFVESNFKEGCRNFVLIDEIQRCDGFEEAVNSLHAQQRWDIYITGSNAFLMSSDLATLFTGRTVEIEVYPFSFREYCSYYNLPGERSSFKKYMTEGGMSGCYNYGTEEMKTKYVKSIYDTLILRDIVQKNGIAHPGYLEKISDYLIDTASNETSSRNIANYLKSGGDEISHVTVSDYLQYLCNAFMFYKIRRYDITGKRCLCNQEKYYLADHSFRYALLGTKNMNYGRTVENIVAIELLRRGYEVYTGVLRNSEVDFVAIKRNRKFYIQISQSISEESTFFREVKPLLAIRDAYPKLLLTNLEFDDYDYEGVCIRDLSRWLSEEE